MRIPQTGQVSLGISVSLLLLLLTANSAEAEDFGLLEVVVLMGDVVSVLEDSRLAAPAKAPDNSK